MKTTLIIVFCILTHFQAFSQSLISTDIGNNILLRPNLGYEYRWKKQAFGASIQWQRNAFFPITEIPTLTKTNGIRTDIYHKYFFYKSVFIESKLRFHSFTATEFLKGWKIISLYNSKKSIEFAEKIGVLINKNKKFQFDLSVGLAYRYRDKSMIIYEDNLYNGTTFLSDDEILAKFPNNFKKEKGFIPHVQLRMFYKIK